MKNLLSKSLLCGVLASTFLIVNCQKAPNRAVNAKVTPAAKPSEVKKAACSEGVVNEAKLAKEMQDALNKELETVKDKTPADLSPEQKDKLTLLINNLYAQSNKLIAAIQAIKIGDKKEDAQACKVADSTKEYDVNGIRGSVATKGKEVKDKTGLDNDAAKNAPAAEEALTVGQELKASAELAKVLSDDTNSKGVVAIVNSAIVKTDAAKAIADKAVTSCTLLINTKEEVKDGQTLKVLSISDVTKDAKSSRNVVSVFLAPLNDSEAGQAAMSLECNLAEGKEKAAAVEVRKALGTLVSKLEVKAAIPATKTSGDSSQAKSGDATKASGDSSSASGDATKAKANEAKANEALSILDNALSRK
ncbi:MAG: hypothetical protein ABL930_02585 [Pseudobdellovibrio sp.]